MQLNTINRSSILQSRTINAFCFVSNVLILFSNVSIYTLLRSRHRLAASLKNQNHINFKYTRVSI